MTPSWLKSLDKTLWLPANVVSRWVTPLFHGRQPRDRAMILRPGGLGDLILVCVALEELGLDPTRFFWLIERRSSEWADHLSLHYQCYDHRPWQLLELAGRYNLVINTEQHFGLSQAAAVMAQSATGRTVAFDTNRAASWATQSVPYDPLKSHESVEFRRLLTHAMGLTHEPWLHPLSRTRKSPPTGQPLVGLGGLQSPSRSLTEESWVALIRDWARHRPFQIASTIQDAPFALRLAHRFPNQTQALQLPFKELCRTIEQAEEVLTMDSGFLQIAAYYGVPTTALFTSGRQDKWAPLARGSVLIKRSDLACQPCALFGQVPPCPHDYVCKALTYSIHRTPIKGGR